MEEMTIKNAETKPVEEVLEEKKPAHKKSKKERMEEVKKEIKEKAALIKELRANKNKTQEEKEKLSSLIDESEELKIEKDTLKKEIDAEKLNASIRQRKKKLADKKQEAIMKLLEAEGITTENYFNVTSTAIITVPKGCCFDISVENVSEGATPGTAPQINVQNANLTVTRIA